MTSLAGPIGCRQFPLYTFSLPLPPSPVPGSRLLVCLESWAGNSSCEDSPFFCRLGATGVEGGKPWDAGQNHPRVGYQRKATFTTVWTILGVPEEQSGVHVETGTKGGVFCRTQAGLLCLGGREGAEGDRRATGAEPGFRVLSYSLHTRLAWD